MTAEMIINKLVEKNEICNSCAEKMIDVLKNGIDGLFPVALPGGKVVWVSNPKD